MKLVKFTAVTAALLTAMSVYAGDGYNGPNQNGADIPIADNGRGILLQDIAQVELGCLNNLAKEVLEQVTRGVEGTFNVGTALASQIETTAIAGRQRLVSGSYATKTLKSNKEEYYSIQLSLYGKHISHTVNELSCSMVSIALPSDSQDIFLPYISFKELKYQRDWLGLPATNASLATNVVINIPRNLRNYEIYSPDGTTKIASMDLASYKECLVSGITQKVHQ